MALNGSSLHYLGDLDKLLEGLSLSFLHLRIDGAVCPWGPWLAWTGAPTRDKQT